MTYTQTLTYLYTRLPMFSRIGAAAIKKDLTNTLLLCEELNNPQDHFKTIHIAGTNGKGSTSHMLAAILQAAGYKTGLYTSPHLKDFRERIKVNGQMMPQEAVVDFVERIIPSIDKIEPSFFEITVAMAFEYFKNEKVDIAIIETGLGGRLDSTNIIHPEISIITNIGWDHMNLLGNTLPAIASEKAGIIKKNTPVVIGQWIPETKPVFENKAIEEAAPLFFATDNYYTTGWTYSHHHLQVTIANKHTEEREDYELDLTGIYQISNLITVLSAVDILKALNWKLGKEAIKKGLSSAKKITGLGGRWEQIHSKPDVILDVAHNEDGIRQVLSQLELTDHNQLHWIIGMVKDKEVEKVLQLLPKEATYYFTKAQIPRAMDELELSEKAHALGLEGQHYQEVNIALKAALAASKEKDLILVCGSVFLVGEVNPLPTH